MLSRIARRYDFANVPRDEWRARCGTLPPAELAKLRVRSRRFAQYRFLRALAVAPVALCRGVANLWRLLGEIETLHAQPRRRMRCGRNCVIDVQTWLVNGERIELGDNVKISAFSTVIAGQSAGIRIGTNTIIGPGVTIVALNHGTAPTDVPIRYQEWVEAPVDIGENVWIGAGVVILPGTTIGPGAVIGAGTVVKGDVPAGKIVYARQRNLASKDRS